MLQHFVNNMFKHLDYQRLSAAWFPRDRDRSPGRAAVLIENYFRKGRGRMKKKRYFSRTVIVLLAILFAFLFVMPTL